MGFSQEMKMQQSLAPQLYQSLEILQMPLVDLQQLVKKELSENPTLDIQNVEPDSNIEIETGTIDSDKFDQEIIALGDDWDNKSSSLGSPRSEEDYQFMIDSLSETESLQDQLMHQLGILKLSEQDRLIAELIIGNIDDDGYLQLDFEELNNVSNFPNDNFERIIKIIQSFDPAGICARNLRECMLLQLERAGESKSNAYILVDKHLDLLGRNKIKEISVLMSITIEEVSRLSERISKLDPKPGQQVDSNQLSYIIPEIFVEKIDGDYVVSSNDKPYPKLFINQNYLRLLKDKKTTQDTKKYIREKLAKSRLMIQSIDQRLNIVERVATEVIKIQKDFFDEGVLGLKPLNMKKIANLLDVHETTISRATSGKYIQTPKGLYDMKYFFKPGVRSASGQVISNEYAKKVLLDLIKTEDKKNPYSDRVLVEKLRETNICISRRTVAKYRDELHILASNLRRRL